MLKPLLKKAIPLLAMMPLLGSCSLFQPQTKVIEYDEEVKLHDGSMIWVHIKRHYGLVGGFSSGHGKSYMPGPVEISWDTGFPNVGRKSVFFDKRVAFIDKFDGFWYLVGTKNSLDQPLKINDSINCSTIGTLINSNHDCLVTLNQKNESLPNLSKDLSVVNMNILYTEGVNIDVLEGTKLSWTKKLEIQTTQMKSNQSVNKPYSYDQIKK